MDSILYSIYAGELHPAEHIKPRFVPEEYAACARRLQQQKDLLCAKLPPEDRAEVEKLEELYNAQGSLLDFDTFACGVRFGVRLLSELYGGATSHTQGTDEAIPLHIQKTGKRRKRPSLKMKSLPCTDMLKNNRKGR